MSFTEKYITYNIDKLRKIIINTITKEAYTNNPKILPIFKTARGWEQEGRILDYIPNVSSYFKTTITTYILKDEIRSEYRSPRIIKIEDNIDNMFLLEGFEGHIDRFIKDYDLEAVKTHQQALSLLYKGAR